MKQRRPLILLPGTGLCLAMLAACGRTPGSGGGEARQRPGDGGPAREVRLARAIMRPMERSIAVTGTLAAWERSTLSAKVPGRLDRLEVDIGSAVRRGDLIAQIERRDYELRLAQAAAALAQARAALALTPEGEDDRVDLEAISAVREANALLEEAAKNHERVRKLVEASIAPQSELETAEAAHTVALTRHQSALEETRMRIATLAQRRAERAIAEKQLEDAALLAPFDGVIQERLAGLGQYLATGAPVVTLVRTDPLRLRLEVPERASAQVRAGQAIRLSAEGIEGEFAGRITRLSPALAEGNRMLLVEADVPNTGGGLRPGLFARARIVVEERDEGLSVPPAAIVTFAGIEKVVTVSEGKALEKTVATGRRGRDWIEILDGIDPGADVVLDPVGLRTGQSVRVLAPPPSAPKSPPPAGAPGGARIAPGAAPPR